MSESAINVADLLHHPGSRRAVTLDIPLSGFELGAARLAEPVHCELILEQVSEGVVARGELSSRWSAACSRCLTDIDRDVTVRMAELFEPAPIDGETYPLVDETIDLDAPLRDAIAGVLPAAPLCRDDCAGLCPICGIDRNTNTCDCRIDTTDPRWDALAALQLQPEESD